MRVFLGKIASIGGLVLLLFFFTSGLFEWCSKVFVWLITIGNSTPPISIVGQLFVKYVTWIITFSLIGILFKSLHWFDSSAMKIVYIIISTIISFILSYIVMILENYLLYIVVGLGVLLLIMIAVIIFLYIKSKHSSENEGVNDGVLQHSNTNK